MKVTAEGQVTIPRDVRERAGLLPGSEVEFEVVDGVVRLLPAQNRTKTRGELIVESLRGKGHFGMTTDEVIEMMRGPPAEV